MPDPSCFGAAGCAAVQNSVPNMPCSPAGITEYCRHDSISPYVLARHLSSSRFSPATLCACPQVLMARKNIPSPHFAFFMDLLADTVRFVLHLHAGGERCHFVALGRSLLAGTRSPSAPNSHTRHCPLRTPSSCSCSTRFSKCRLLQSRCATVRVTVHVVWDPCRGCRA